MVSSMKIKALVLSVFILFISKFSHAEDAVLIEGEGIEITESEVGNYIDNLLVNYKDKYETLDEATVGQIAELLYVTKLLAKTAEDNPYIENEKVKWLGEFQVNSTLKEALLNVEAQALIKNVNFEDMAQKAYEKNKGQFETEKQVRASHILLRTQNKDEEAVLKQILELKGKAEKGHDFALMARAHSQDPSARRNGGDLGFFTKGKMVPAFEAKAFSMQVGEISEPVKTEFGFHIIKVSDIRGGGVKPFEEVKSSIIDSLKNDMVQKYKVERISKLAENASTKPSLKVISRVLAKHKHTQGTKD